MSVWQEIDLLRKNHSAEFTATSNGVEAEGAVKESLSCDGFGNWLCRYIPKGERAHKTLSAKSGADLIRALKAIRAAEAEAEKRRKWKGL